jgi:hypothetical protein
VPALIQGETQTSGDFMKSLFTALLLLVSAQAFAGKPQLPAQPQLVAFDCNNGAQPESYFSISMDQTGKLSFQHYETQAEIDGKNVEAISSEEAGALPQTEIVLARKVSIPVTVEGDSQQTDASVVFVYNPVQKAGRLTMILGGGTEARNELLSHCK